MIPRLRTQLTRRSQFSVLMSTSTAATKYAGWSREQLIERLSHLEGQQSIPSSSPPPLPAVPPVASTSNALDADAISGNPKSTRTFDFYTYPRRKIALKFCYSGSEYGGLAFQLGETPLPTVEGVLFDALAHARLVDSEGGFDGCSWERCGRTDRGVSGAGQVVSFWVRSALPVEELEEYVVGRPGLHAVAEATEEGEEDSAPTTAPDEIQRHIPLPQSRSEHDYVTILNRLLPPSIRVFAWSPVASTFSPRFACQWRHYKYFFSPSNLSLPAMEDAASRLVGEHDFRNLCKLDAAKQITSFKRSIMAAYIERFDDDLYVFNLRGSAFLYNQVRHIMAVLFLIGTGLEPPSLMSALLNVSEGAEGDYPVVDCKPEYQMADGHPLVLWDCGYPEGTFDWRTCGRPSPIGDNGELHRELTNIFQRSQITTALHSHFLKAAEQFHAPPKSIFPLEDPEKLQESKERVWGGKAKQEAIHVPLGGGTEKRFVKYVRVLQRKRLDPVEVANERWRVGKGKRKSERKRAVAEEPVEETKMAATG